MKRTKLSTIIGAVALITAPFAAAVPTLYFDIGDDGTQDGIAILDQSGSDSNGDPGTVAYNFMLGGFEITVGGSTKPAIGSATDPRMANINLETVGSGTIAIYFTDDGFGPTFNQYLAQLTVNPLLTPSVTADYYSYATIAPFAGVFSGVGSPMTSLTQTGSGTPTAGGVLPFPGATVGFTLTQKVVITQASGSSLVTATLRSVPDGGTTLALLGASLLGIGAVRRKLAK